MNTMNLIGKRICIGHTVIAINPIVKQAVYGYITRAKGNLINGNMEQGSDFQISTRTFIKLNKDLIRQESLNELGI